MKEENKHAWEQLDAQWRKQLHEQEEPAPAFNWEKLDAKATQPVIPMWRKVTQSPWAWAAVLGIAIGINWQPVEIGQNALPIFAMDKKSTLQSSSPVIGKQSLPQIATAPTEVAEVSGPTVVYANPIEVNEVPSLSESPNITEKVEEDAIYVRVDIDPIEEKHIQPAVEVMEKPIKRKRNLLGQILRQVIAGEPGGWRDIANSNEKLTEGIHQVANTVIRTEQSVKQTLQLQ